MSVTPVVSLSCWNGFFCDCKCYVYCWWKETSTKLIFPIGWLSFTLLAVQTYNLNSKLPTQTHQLHRLDSRTAFSNTITSHRKTAVLLKLSNLALKSFSLQSPKCNVYKPTQWLGKRELTTFDLRAILQKRVYFQTTSNKMIYGIKQHIHKF